MSNCVKGMPANPRKPKVQTMAITSATMPSTRSAKSRKATTRKNTMSRKAAGTVSNSESVSTDPNSSETMPDPKTVMSPSTLSSMDWMRCWMGVSGLSPLWPDPSEMPAGTPWDIVPMVAEADALGRLKSLLTSPVNRSLVAARSRTARRTSVRVALSRAVICSSSPSASGSISRATSEATLAVDWTRRSGRCWTRCWRRNIRSIEAFERTFVSRWMSDVLPVSGSNDGENSRWTSWSASSEGRPVVNCWVPVSVEMFPIPSRNAPVSSKNRSTTHRELLTMWWSTQSMYCWWSTAPNRSCIRVGPLIPGGGHPRLRRYR